MPHRLKQRQAKIQAKRKTTPWREFVMEICSWKTMTFSLREKHITIFPKTKKKLNIVSNTKFEEIRWDISLPIESQKSFFEQFWELFTIAPLPCTTDYWWNENTTYSDCVYWAKNAYLTSVVWWTCENVAYSCDVRYNAHNVHNSFFVNTLCDHVFYSLGINQSSRIFYSKYIKDCTDIWRSTNLIWCTHCIWCSDLQNVSYHINNIPSTPEEYNHHKAKKLREKASFHHRYELLSSSVWKNRGSTWSLSWSHIVESSNIINGYSVFDVHTWRNIILAGSPHDDRNYYDSLIVWRATDFWWVCVWWWFSEHCYMCSNIWWWSYGVYYSFFMDGCSYCLWCIWLKNKSYCIFNTQYTKEERYDKVDEIFTQMEQDGDLWKFFPWSMNPFYFNDTAAYLIDDSFTKAEVEAQWYMRRDEHINVDIPAWVEVISVDDLDQHEGRMLNWQFISTTDIQNHRDNARDMSRHITPSILKKVIKDPQWNVYRIVKMEYDFLMKHWLPLPRKHRLERIKEHFKIEKRSEIWDTWL